MSYERSSVLVRDDPDRPWRSPTLRDVIQQGVGLWAFCLFCGNGNRLNPRDLVHKFGDATFDRIAAKLKCRRCGNRDGIVTVDPHRSYKR